LNVDNTRHTFSADMNGIQKSRDQSYATLTSVSDTVGSKRKFLEDTVTSVIGNVDTAIVEGCSVVETTSETANKILRDVNSAAVRMNDSASAFMRGFTAYMNQEGDNISSELGKHFSAVEAHLAAQRAGLEGINTSAVAHGENIVDTELKPTGNTPKKTIFVPREAVAPTRNHTEIRSEVREQLILSNGANYDAISGVVAGSYVAVALPTSRSSSPVENVPSSEEVVSVATVSTKSLLIDTFAPVSDENAAPNSTTSVNSTIPRPLSTKSKSKSIASGVPVLEKSVSTRSRNNSAVDMSEGI